jgi:hypothetical protein
MRKRKGLKKPKTGRSLKVQPLTAEQICKVEDFENRVRAKILGLLDGWSDRRDGKRKLSGFSVLALEYLVRSSLPKDHIWNERLVFLNDNARNLLVKRRLKQARRRSSTKLIQGTSLGMGVAFQNFDDETERPRWV